MKKLIGLVLIGFAGAVAFAQNTESEVIRLSIDEAVE